MKRNNGVEKKQPEPEKQLDCEKQLDLLYQEFMFEHNRADVYIERNYQVLGLWAAALAGLYAIGMNEDFVKTEMANFLIFSAMVPVLNFMFAIIYFFNSYANLRCGDRAGAIHKALFSRAVMGTFEQIQMDGTETRSLFLDLLPKYVLTETYASLPMYVSLILVILSSTAFGYFYTFSTCEGKQLKTGVIISAVIFGVSIVIVSVLYIYLMIKHSKPRDLIKKSK